MRRSGSQPWRLVALLTAMVVLPIAALAWLGVRYVGEQEATAKRQVSVLLEDRLREVDGTIIRFMEEHQRRLRRVVEPLPMTPKAIRNYLKANARDVDVLVVGSADGKLQFPPLNSGVLTSFERELVERTRPIWQDGALDAAIRAKADESTRDGSARADEGWLTYYHGSGLNLIFWRRSGKRIVAAELSRIRLLSDLVAYLPSTKAFADGSFDSLTTLSDANGASLYEWGTYRPGKDESARVTLPLSSPLAAWSLRHYSAPDALPDAPAAGWGGLLAGLLGIAVALMLVAVLLYRQRRREMAVAAQRVSFVNQVSHELKTPLTNIRLYAELLSGQLDVDDLTPDEVKRDPVARNLSVINEETARLSRLIHNVLTFSRDQQDALELRPRSVDLDKVIATTVDAQRGSLAKAKLAVELDGTIGVGIADPDALTHIVSNLLSNAEKYAATGERVVVSTSREGEWAKITVRDFGPGIPETERERIFEPFQRLTSRVNEGVSGTGIGLDIARRLARLHGGDLTLVASQPGACFVASLRLDPPAATAT